MRYQPGTLECGLSVRDALEGLSPEIRRIHVPTPVRGPVAEQSATGFLFSNA